MLLATTLNSSANVVTAWLPLWQAVKRLYRCVLRRAPLVFLLNLSHLHPGHHSNKANNLRIDSSS